MTSQDLQEVPSEGCGIFQRTVDGLGRRSSNSEYLRWATRQLGQKNSSNKRGGGSLTVVTEVLVENLLFVEEDRDKAEEEEGKAEGNSRRHRRPRAVGVQVKLADGRRRKYRCKREVLLCAGVINSPKLLLLGGIGPPDVLARAGIDCRVASPGVGRGLRDNASTGVVFQAARNGDDSSGGSGSTSGGGKSSMDKALRTVREAAKLLLFGTGAWTTNFVETAAFFRTTDNEKKKKGAEEDGGPPDLMM